MYVSPLHYYIDANYGILLKGGGANILLPQAPGILVLGGALLGFGLARFRRRLS